MKAADITSTSFVIATGGHSPWSSIGDDGVVIDMSMFKGIKVEPSSGVVRVWGGVLHKEFQVALAREGQCTSLWFLPIPFHEVIVTSQQLLGMPIVLE